MQIVNCVKASLVKNDNGSTYSTYSQTGSRPGKAKRIGEYYVQISERVCSAAETAGHISSELLTTVGTQKNQRRESEARAEREKAEAELRYAKARIENARALQEEIKADYMRDVQECYREYLKQNIAKVSGLPFVERLPPAEAGDPE